MGKKVIAPCGIDCFNCELFKDNVTDEFQDRLSKNCGIPKEKLICNGCTDGNQCLFLDFQGKKCKTLECVEKKGVEYCFECDSFPCPKLMPTADGANKYPHNIKLYNLCLMKKIGIDRWIEQAKSIRKSYFTSSFSIGDGASQDENIS